MEDFVLVRRGQKRCARGPALLPATLTLSADYHETSSRSVHQHVLERRKEIASSPFLSSFHRAVDTAVRGVGGHISLCVCYGIGPVASSHASQHQLAVMLELRDWLQPSRVEVYDPILNSSEQGALSHLGLELVQTNEHCRRTVVETTLFFMPHCGMAMYNNLLWANWGPSKLSSIVLIGNQFSSYWERLTEKQFEEQACYIYQVQQVCQETPLPVYPEPNVLNDTAIHLFPSHQLRLLEDDVWLDPPEPTLDPHDREMTL